jgi:hypothetical protein
VHLWTQIVGKVRLSRAAWQNHSWQSTLYVTTRGLSTSPIPHGAGTFDMEFDFLRHRLDIRTSGGGERSLALEPQSVAAFYARVMEALASLAVPVRIHTRPNEIADPIPFDRDDAHRAYDREYASRFWQVLVRADRVLKVFRGRFVGKCSPVHFFWGAPDLAVTRFSGRPAPEHPGGVPNLPDSVARDAYSHEVSSCGFWPGGGAIAYPAFYSYAYPEPPGFRDADPGPQAFYSPELREFILPYETVARSSAPDDRLLEFAQATYVAAAGLGRWDRESLERAV